MSKKDAIAFLNRLADDKALARQVKDAGKEQIPDLAREAGYSFTLEEMDSIVGEITGDKDELSDDLLEKVVGGLNIHNAEEWMEMNFYRLSETYDALIGKVSTDIRTGS